MIIKNNVGNVWIKGNYLLLYFVIVNSIKMGGGESLYHL